jgi:hypothetical protein
MKKIILSIFSLLSVSRLNAAIDPNYNLHCELSGDLVKIADETVPAREHVGNNTLNVNLHLKGGAGGFYTTGPDYYVKFKLGDRTVSVYLHSSGYEFPLSKTVGLRFTPPGGRILDLFTTEAPDYGNTVVTSNLLTTLGVQGLDEFTVPLRVTCNDYGSQ